MPTKWEQESRDILKRPAPTEPPRLTSRRIGIHTSTSGGVETAAERAYRLGCNTFQIFSSSPRMWKPYQLAKGQCGEMIRLREKYGIVPLVIHTSYLVNLASVTEEFLNKSIQAFRGEVERALALGAQYLVLHAGSYRGLRREEGLARAAFRSNEVFQLNQDTLVQRSKFGRAMVDVSRCHCKLCSRQKWSRTWSKKADLL
ncbi:MAG: hypothetical protein DMG60_09180 [Acidobacteria bacterium]|nr:MAG: hypothetical protein DMG60_09180 [Acidobacteriota bacterium]